MKKTTFLLSLLTLAFFSLSCINYDHKVDEELLQLKDWMVGSFSSQEQAEADTNFFDIRLEMVEIWESESDTIWLYVEQAAACALVFELFEGEFKGSTDERKCSSTLRGSTYATSEVVIGEEVLTSLDRGYDDEDMQVWGSEYGPYIFKKLNPVAE